MSEESVVNIQMPRYACHKEVWALKIDRIEVKTDGSALLYPVDQHYAPISVDKEWVEKRGPTSDGYFVKYVDGYTSWSPTEAFELGYMRI